MKKVDLKFRLVQNNVTILGLRYTFIYTKLEVIVIIKFVCYCSPSSNPSKWKWVTEIHSTTKGKSAVQKRSINKNRGSEWRLTAPLDLQLDFLYFCFRLTLLICPFKRHKRKRVRRSKLLLRCFLKYKRIVRKKLSNWFSQFGNGKGGENVL